MNVEAVNDVDIKYYLKPRSIVSVQVRAGDVWVDTVCAYILLSYGPRSSSCRIVMLR